MAGDERATVHALLSYQRESLIGKAAGVGDTGAWASPVPSGTSLLWLINHMADAEITWVLRRFARIDDPALTTHADTLDGAIGRYRQVSEAVDRVVGAVASLDDTCPPFDTEPAVNLRWILLHLLEETARHAGHADIIRETLDGSTGR